MTPDVCIPVFNQLLHLTSLSLFTINSVIHWLGHDNVLFKGKWLTEATQSLFITCLMQLRGLNSLLSCKIRIRAILLFSVVLWPQYSTPLNDSLAHSTSQFYHGDWRKTFGLFSWSLCTSYPAFIMSSNHQYSPWLSLNLYTNNLHLLLFSKAAQKLNV